MDIDTSSVPPMGPHGLPRDQRRRRNLPVLRLQTNFPDEIRRPVQELVRVPINPWDVVHTGLSQPSLHRRQRNTNNAGITPYNPAAYGVFGLGDRTPTPITTQISSRHANNQPQSSPDSDDEGLIIGTRFHSLRGRQSSQNTPSSTLHSNTRQGPQPSSGGTNPRIRRNPHHHLAQVILAGPTGLSGNLFTQPSNPQITQGNNFVQAQVFAPVPRIPTTLSVVFHLHQYSPTYPTSPQAAPAASSHASSTLPAISTSSADHLRTIPETANQITSLVASTASDRYSFVSGNTDHQSRRFSTLTSMLNEVDGASVSERSSIDPALLPEPLFANRRRGLQEIETSTSQTAEDQSSYPYYRGQPFLTGYPPQDWTQGAQVHPAFRDNFGDVMESTHDTVRIIEDVTSQPNESQVNAIESTGQNRKSQVQTDPLVPRNEGKKKKEKSVTVGNKEANEHHDDANLTKDSTSVRKPSRRNISHQTAFHRTPSGASIRYGTSRQRLSRLELARLDSSKQDLLRSGGSNSGTSSQGPADVGVSDQQSSQNAVIQSSSPQQALLRLGSTIKENPIKHESSRREATVSLSSDQALVLHELSAQQESRRVLCRSTSPDQPSIHLESADQGPSRRAVSYQPPRGEPNPQHVFNRRVSLPESSRGASLRLPSPGLLAPPPTVIRRRRHARNSFQGRRFSYQEYFEGSHTDFEQRCSINRWNAFLVRQREVPPVTGVFSPQGLADGFRYGFGQHINQLLGNLTRNGFKAFRTDSAYLNPFQPLVLQKQEFQDLYEMSKVDDWIAREAFEHVKPRVVVNCGLYSSPHPLERMQNVPYNYMYDTEDVTPFDQVYVRELRIYIPLATGFLASIFRQRVTDTGSHHSVETALRDYRIDQCARLQQLSILVEWAHKTFHNLRTITFTGNAGQDETFDCFATRVQSDIFHPRISESCLPLLPNVPGPLCRALEVPDKSKIQDVPNPKSPLPRNSLRQALGHTKPPVPTVSLDDSLDETSFGRFKVRVKESVQSLKSKKAAVIKQAHLDGSSMSMLSRRAPQQEVTSIAGPPERGAWRKFLAHSAFERTMQYITDQKKVTMIVFEKGFFQDHAAFAAHDASDAAGTEREAAMEYLEYLRNNRDGNEYIPRHDLINALIKHPDPESQPIGPRGREAVSMERAVITQAAAKWRIPETEPGAHRLRIGYLEGGRLALTRGELDSSSTQTPI